MSRNSFLLLSLLLSACSTGNTVTNVSNKTNDNETTSVSVTVPPMTTKAPAKELEVTHGSVVNSKKHVIVNAANKWLAPGGLLSGAIFQAAGSDKVLAEIASKHAGISNPSMSGKALLETSNVFTTASYKLAEQGTQYIIHALGPDFTEMPYSSNLDQGYTALRQTYKNVYKEMDRLNKAYALTTIGIVPISSGVFAGAADKINVYKIMIEETLFAMQTYPEIQPELYLFGSMEYDAVKSLLPSTVSLLAPSSVLSSGASTSVSKMVLLESPTYQEHVCSDEVSGIASSVGSIRFIGTIVEGSQDKKAQFIVGTMSRNSFLGCEFETAYRERDFAHFSVKAMGSVQYSDSVKLVGGVGYACENMSAGISNNVLSFLNLDKKEYKRQGVMYDVIAQHRANITPTVSITTHVGISAGYLGSVMIAPFANASFNIQGLGVSTMVSLHEIGINFHHHH